jgi:hypothetical protein
MWTVSPSCARTADHSPIEPLQRSRARYLRYVELDNPTPGRALTSPGSETWLPTTCRADFIPSLPGQGPSNGFVISYCDPNHSNIAGVTAASGESEVREAIARLGREGYEGTRIGPPLEHVFSNAPKLLQAQLHRSSASGSYC